MKDDACHFQLSLVPGAIDGIETPRSSASATTKFSSPQTAGSGCQSSGNTPEPVSMPLTGPGCTPPSTGLPNPLPGLQSHVPEENRGPPPVGVQEKAPIGGVSACLLIPVATVTVTMYQAHPVVLMPVSEALTQPERLGFQGPDDGQATSSCQEARPRTAPKPQKGQRQKTKARGAQNQKTSGQAPKTSKETEDGRCEGADEPKNPEKRTQPNKKNREQLTLGPADISFRVGDLEKEVESLLEKVGLLAAVQSFRNDRELTWNCHSLIKSHTYHDPSVESSKLLGFIVLKSSNDSEPLKISGRIWLCPEAETYNRRCLVRWILAQVPLHFFSYKVFSRDHDVGRNHWTLPLVSENTQIEAGAKSRTLFTSN